MTSDSISIAIIYFSGTGNTKILANLYSKEFKNRGATVDTFAIEDINNNRIVFNPSKYDLIGIGYVIHAFNAPRIVFDFINKMPKSENKSTFIFKCPGDSYAKAGATTMVRNSLKKRGYIVFHEDLILMPANIFIKYEDELSKELFEIAKIKINIFSEQILTRKEKLQDNTSILRFVTRIISGLESMGSRFFGKNFKVSKSCNKCLICTNICPMKNITFKNDRIKFGWKCVLCMRCIYKCPNKSISPKIMKFFVLKEGYDIEKIINDSKLKGNFLSKNKQGFLRRLYDYSINFD